MALRLGKRAVFSLLHFGGVFVFGFCFILFFFFFCGVACGVVWFLFFELCVLQASKFLKRRKLSHRKEVRIT